VTTDRHSVARSFFELIGSRDVDAALKLAAPGAPVRLVPMQTTGSLAVEGRRYFEALANAFPDLRVRIRSLFVTTDGTAVVEVTVEGTQAGEFVGIINQEKHMDLDQAWMLHIADDGLVDAATGYWCQVMLYRRLAVKRLDRVTITAA
jgi:ketosteroid isomerase-like protein